MEVEVELDVAGLLLLLLLPFLVGVDVGAVVEDESVVEVEAVSKVEVRVGDKVLGSVVETEVAAVYEVVVEAKSVVEGEAAVDVEVVVEV